MHRYTKSLGNLSNNRTFFKFILLGNVRSTGRTDVLSQNKFKFRWDRHDFNRFSSCQFLTLERVNTAFAKRILWKCK